jgi:hypothetical protein
MARVNWACGEDGLAVEGPCKGHKCDNCRACRAGRCCRRDRPGYKLPGVGDWDGPMYGKLGSLTSNDGGATVVCHVCGEDHVSLVYHVNAAHGMNVREYKAIFGLPMTTGLCSPDFTTRSSATAKRLGKGGWSEENMATPEQKRKGAEVSAALKRQRSEHDLLRERDWLSGKGTCKRGHLLTAENVGENRYRAGSRRSQQHHYYCRRCANELGEVKRRSLGAGPRRKLRPEEIADIRSRFEFGSMGPNGVRSLAAEYGVHRATIHYHTKDLCEGKVIPEDTIRERNRLATEAVKRRKRPDTCKRGHSYSGDNLYVSPSGHTYCKACKREREEGSGHGPATAPGSGSGRSDGRRMATYGGEA